MKFEVTPTKKNNVTKGTQLFLFQACKGCVGTYRCDCSGIKGLQGALGIFGLRGSEGQPGDIGPEGPTGPKGEKGAAGEYGSAGEKGYRVSTNKFTLISRKNFPLSEL